jgi:hypothetical protein
MSTREGYHDRMLRVGCALGLALLGGCNVGAGTGSFAGSLYLRGCTKDGDLGSASAPALFDLKPTFFVAEPIDDFQKAHPMNRLSIRIQSAGNRVEEADVLYINMASVLPVAQTLGSAVPVGIGADVRAALVLNQTCPTAEVEAELDGQVTFTAFGAASGSVPEDFRIQFGDHLAGSLSVDVVDRRMIALGGIGGVAATPAAGGHLAGQFDFVVHQGRAAQVYP